MIFPSAVDAEDLEGMLWYIEVKGYCAAAVLNAPDGTRYPVNFVTPIRATQEVEYSNAPYIEEGLIIVPNTRLETMQSAATQAWHAGFFKHLVPLANPNE